MCDRLCRASVSMSSRLIHVVVYLGTSFLFTVKYTIALYGHSIFYLFFHDGHLGSFLLPLGIILL
jgi:hypothetical protein